MRFNERSRRARGETTSTGMARRLSSCNKTELAGSKQGKCIEYMLSEKLPLVNNAK